jgi:hypothetical protein
MSRDDEYCIWHPSMHAHQTNEEYQHFVREIEEREEREAREAAAIDKIVDLIRSRIAPAGNHRIKDKGGEVIIGGEVIATPFWVEYTVIFLRQMFQLNKDKSPWGNVRENEKALNEIVENLQALQRSLDKLPDGFRYLVCSNEMPGLMSLKFRATMAREHSKAQATFRHFIVTLKAMEDRFGELLRKPPGERSNTNYRNKLIALCAADLLDLHSVRPTRGNDAKPSLFEQIASSLLEAVTGEQGVDLTYACRRVLEEWETQNYFRAWEVRRCVAADRTEKAGTKRGSAEKDLRNDFNQSEGNS